MSSSSYSRVMPAKYTNTMSSSSSSSTRNYEIAHLKAMLYEQREQYELQLEEQREHYEQRLLNQRDIAVQQRNVIAEHWQQRLQEQQEAYEELFKRLCEGSERHKEKWKADRQRYRKHYEGIISKYTDVRPPLPPPPDEDYEEALPPPKSPPPSKD